MKPNHANESLRDTRTGAAFKNACLATCQKILAQVAKAKEAIFAEYRGALQSQERLLRLTLNEAEALAWQTKYPHLVFPTLATEKVQAIAGWNDHQQRIRPREKVIAFAA